MTFSAGERVGPYQIVSLIGYGGMGEVYKAHDTRLGRDVAIKVSTLAFNERFEREGRAVAALNHPNICQLYDVGALPSGSGFLVMEYIEGERLKGPCRSTPRCASPGRSRRRWKKRTRRASSTAI
jgi:serine/threonine protein kinase